jgi:hypothetical protein
VAGSTTYEKIQNETRDGLRDDERWREGRRDGGYTEERRWIHGGYTCRGET